MNTTTYQGQTEDGLAMYLGFGSTPWTAGDITTYQAELAEINRRAAEFNPSILDGFRL